VAGLRLFHDEKSLENKIEGLFAFYGEVKVVSKSFGNIACEHSKRSTVLIGI